MKQEYFIHNEKKYKSGDIIMVNQFNYHSCKLCKTQATFLYYDADNNTYAFKIGNDINVYSEKDFKRIFYGEYNEVVNQHIDCLQTKKLTFKKELAIEGLFLAWIWYIFIMAVAIIFKGRICIWIIASLVFFNYRNKKLKEARYK